MSENRRRVLEMLSEGKVSVDEAERLIGLVDEDAAVVKAPQVLPPRKGPARYLRVIVDSNGSSEHVDVRVPLALIKAGVKLHTLVPGHAADGISEALKNHGIDADVRQPASRGRGAAYRRPERPGSACAGREQQRPRLASRALSHGVSQRSAPE